MKNRFYKAARVLCALAVCVAFAACSNDDERSDYYTVSYSTSRGTHPASVVVEDGTVLTDAHLPLLVAEGYDFAGWHTDTTSVTAGTYTVRGDVTLVAQWNAHTYTVVFNANEGSGSMESIFCTYDAEQTLPANTFTRADYGFVGWNTAADGRGKPFANGAGAKNITTENGATVTLYAQWQELILYDITYELDGGTNATANKPIYTISDTVTFADPTRAGYDFAGWYTSEDFADGTNITSTAENTGSLMVYARWARIYTVSYELDGGTNAETNETAYSAINMLTFATPTRTGYVFAGWNTAADGTGASVTDTADKAENLTLYAQWNCTPYTITYKNEDGSDFAPWYELPATYTIEDTVSFLQGENATEQYAYPELYTAQDFSGTAVTGWESGMTGDKTLYVHYVCTASTAGNTIKKLTGAGPHTVVVRGAITQETIQAIADGINAVYVEDDETKRTLIALDMAEANGVQSILGENTVTGDIKNFYNCKGLHAIVIPDSVTGVDNCAFYGCSNLASVKIPDGVTWIWSQAFQGCTNLTSVEIPNSVTRIESAAFEGCSRLASITIPNSVTRIGNRAFYGCSSLTSLEIPNGVTSIGAFAFCNCACLTAINIPQSVISIEVKAFDTCAQLASVEIWGDATIEWRAFFECPVLTSVKIQGDANIGEEAFANCSSLTLLELSDKVTGIGSKAFQNCTSLISVEIPNSVTSIESAAFYGCSSLQSVKIPNGVTRIEDAIFWGCSHLASIEMPSSITSIGDAAFSGCHSLTSVTIPDTVTSIGEAAFTECRKLTALTIPASVTSIGAWAFWNTDMLTSLTFEDADNWYCTDSEDDWNARQNGTLITDTSTLFNPENFHGGMDCLYYKTYFYKLTE